MRFADALFVVYERLFPGISEACVVVGFPVLDRGILNILSAI